LIICEYSINEIFNEYKNGTPISEIVNKTGIKRKTWNKRFERLEKKHKIEINNKNNNYSDLIIHEKAENNGCDNSVIINNKNGDIGDKMAENVTTTNTFDLEGDCEAIKGNNGRKNTLAWLSIIFLLIGLILLFKWIYDKWKLSKNAE
jgi:transposase